jgi:hypothetical protein
MNDMVLIAKVRVTDNAVIGAESRTVLGKTQLARQPGIQVHGFWPLALV